MIRNFEKNTQWMRCVELKMKDKEKIDLFGNLITARVKALWKPGGKHAKQKSYVSSWSAQLQTSVYKCTNSFLL